LPPKLLAPQAVKPKANIPKLNVPRIDVPLNIAGGPYLGTFLNVPTSEVISEPTIMPVMDDDAMPLVRIPPRYPRAASRRGIEGIVVISFTITKDGQVRDPVIESARPEHVFNNSALKAIMKWKFKPKMIDGQAVERQATQEIEFKLTK
jgi:protein TonB